MATSIRDKGMLATLSISRWRPTVTDRKATQLVESAAKANGAGKYKKDLIPKEVIAPLAALESSLRANFYIYTINWGDHGDRFLPGRLMFEFRQKHTELKDKFYAEVDNFVSYYPKLLHAAATDGRLGDLYNPKDYPPPSALKGKFGVFLDWAPVPESDKDFRFQCEKDMERELREEITESFARKQKNIVQGCIDRLIEVVKPIHERLSDEEATFRDSLIENARRQVDLLVHLNITDDPEIEELRLAVERLLTPPQRLRDDKTLRADRARQAQELLERMGVTA